MHSRVSTRMHQLKSIFAYCTRCFLDVVVPLDDVDRRISTLTPEQLARYSAPHTSKQGIFSLFRYRDPIIRRMIVLLKYHNNQRVARLFGEVLADTIIEDLAERDLFERAGVPLLVPIPLSRARAGERGYNQTERIASTLQKILRENVAPAQDVLVRIKNTAPQSTLSRKERHGNVIGAFTADKIRAQGQHILLLDDVTTTGSTLLEARKALLKAGAREVECIALAR